MRKIINPTLVGIFFVAAVIFLVLLLVVLVPGRTLDTGYTYVLYFKGSLQGMHVGTSVTYRGLKIGQVTGVKLIYNKKQEKFLIPIFIQFLKDRAGDADTPQTVKDLIAKGLRARIYTISILRGERAIALVMEPESKPYYHKNITKYPEIPTLTTSTEELDVAKAMKTAQNAFASFDKFIQDPELKQMIKNTSNTMDTASVTMKDTKRLVNNMNANILPLTVKFETMMDEVSGAAFSQKALMEYLSRQPQSLLFGKR